jgi:hypothetical protein
MRTLLSFAVVGLTLAVTAPSALAQDNGTGGTTTPPPAGTGTPAAGGTAQVSTTTTVTPTATTTKTDVKPAAKEEDEGVPDHDKFVGHLAVGYLGLTNLPIGSGASALSEAGAGGAAGAAGGAIPQVSLPTPVVGVRYWINHLIGVDAGLGFSLASRSVQAEQNNTTTTTDGASPFGIAIHGGVPLAIATGKHYTFEIIPEANVGFTSQTDKGTGNNPPPDLHHSGFRLDVGARVGAEVHFGFIGVPELALVGSVGLMFRRQVWHNSQDAGPGACNGAAGPCSSSFGQTELTTTVQSDPWALFVNNISALYYF